MIEPSSATFRDPRWLRQHVTNLLGFYYPRCIDEVHGGYVPQISDYDGTIYEGRTKHLVATCRFVFNFAVGHAMDGPDWCRTAAERGLQFLRSAHRDHDTEGFAWLLEGREVVDDTRSTYGHAFALLAFATAAAADVGATAEDVRAVYDLVDEHFWEADRGLCRSDLDADWEPTSAYRGQNANMHMCEALLAAHEATGRGEYLDRAYAIADALARELADEGDGLLWEHYTDDWEHDWAYNRDRPTDLFRPWGYQPGHLLEWSKLLAKLSGHREEPWLLDRAGRFFDAAVQDGWDDRQGGFVYTVDRDGEPVVEDKYYWPLAEGIGATAVLADATGEERYERWYDRIWEYAWEHVVNPRHGNWYFRLGPDNRVPDDLDDVPKVTVGYHPVGACFDALRTAGAVEFP